MDIKILSKINIFLTEFVVFSKMVVFFYFKNSFTKFLLIFSLFTTGIGFFINLFPTIPDAHIFIDDLLCQLIFYLSSIYFLTFIISFLLFLIGDILLEYINKHFYLNISLAKINTVSYLFVRHHTSSKFNLELRKLSKSIKNKSNIYSNLDKNDFPQINKLFRRLGYHFQKDKNQNTNSTLNFVNNNDLTKLNIKKQNMLTLDYMDNELNDIIHNQMKNLNKEKVL